MKYDFLTAENMTISLDTSTLADGGNVSEE
jgi:hypothetical protein